MKRGLSAEQRPWLKQREAPCSGRPGHGGKPVHSGQGSDICPRDSPWGTYQLIPEDLAFLLLGYPAKEKQIQGGKPGTPDPQFLSSLKPLRILRGEKVQATQGIQERAGALGAFWDP